MCTEITIQIGEDAEQHVSVSYKEHGVNQFKTISYQSFEQCLLDSIHQPAISSGLLPRNCIAYKWLNTKQCMVTLVFDRESADLVYEKRELKKFPLPQMVFRILVEDDIPIQHCWIGVVGTGRLKPDTPMYYYPFPNLYNDGRVCLGYNKMPKYRIHELYKVETLPFHILSIPHNGDLFNTGYNQKSLSMPQLVEDCLGKKQEYLYKNVLIPNGRTLSDFLKEGE